MIKKWSKYVISFIFAFFISLTVTHAKELTLSELADKVLEIEPNATSVFVIGQHVFTSEHLLTTQDTMLAARTITASSNSAGREIYDEMTISYFEGTYDDDWNVVGFEFYQNLVGKTPAKDSYNICYVDYTYICDGSEVVTPTKYKVTFVNEYGTAPTAQSIEAGGKAVEPSIVDVEGYDFIGWYLGEDKYNFETAISGDITLTARYKKQAQLTTNVGDTTVGTVYEFEVTTIANDYAGVMVVGTSSFSNPEAIEKLEYYEPITDNWYELTSDFGPSTGFPLGDVTSRFRVTWKTPGEYTFTMKIVEVADKSNVLAQVEKTVNITTSKHTVTWVDEDGTVLETDTNVEYGTKPTFDGKTPSKESTDEYTYEFAGWDKEVSNVTEDVIYKATYTTTKNKYTVTFVNYDGTILYESEVEYGKVPEYTGETPTKESDNTYSYTFDKWNKEIVAVTKDVEYTATFKESYIEYTIKFVDEDGTELSSKTYHYGDTVTIPNNPSKDATDKYIYEFAGWDKEVTTVAKNETYKATYNVTELINVDQLVNNAFDTINGYGATDKFEASLNENTVTVTVIDPTMNSIEALIGTGIAPAASEFLKTEGIKSVTLTSGEAELVVTKTNLKPTDVYNFLIAITKDSATAADLDGTIINISIAMEDGFETLNSDSFEVVIDVKTPAEITTTVGDAIVGEVHEFEVTTIANDYAGVMVLGTSSFSNPEAIEKLEYYEPSLDTWFELTTDFGPASGFPLGNVTSRFRVTWKTPGEYTFTMNIVDVNDKTKVYAELEKTVTVSESVALVANEGELLAALANPDYAKIELTDDITITSSVVISRSVVIDGKGHSIAKEGTPTYVSGGNNYIFKVYGITTADVKLENIKLTNAMAAIMVGDYAHVSLDNVDLDGNVWGGIEVKDTSTTSLYVNAENLTYSEEAYGKPIAWVDAPEIANASISFVLENTDWSVTTSLVKNQTHYYLDAANAVE